MRTTKRHSSAASTWKRTLIAGCLVACSAASLVGIGALASAQDSGGPRQDSPATGELELSIPLGSPDVRDMDIPEGKVPIASSDGSVPGFVDAEASSSVEGYPVLDLPSIAEVHGLPVSDASGALVGYLLEGFGFVERGVAEAPGGIDQLIADREAEIADLPPEIQAQIDEIQQGGDNEALIPPG